MDKPHDLTEGTMESLEEQLLPAVNIIGVEDEANLEKVNELAFELYKEAVSLVNLASNLFDTDAAINGGWHRNQAICAGLLVRIYKFMLVVTQLSAGANRADVVMALNRSILETAINLEFLVSMNEDKYFDQFVTFGLGPERELYDTIQKNIAERNGTILPIERRMLNSIAGVCRKSGVRIEDVERKHREWGRNLRDRLKMLGKEEQYAGTIRLPSHAVHGNWVDIYMHHLEVNELTGLFRPRSQFSIIDDRLLGPIAILVFDAVRSYLKRYFATISEIGVLLKRMDDISDRILTVGDAHERLIGEGE